MLVTSSPLSRIPLHVMTIEQMRMYSRMLTQPDRTYRVAGAQFDIFVAKDEHTDLAHPLLWRFVAQARRSYFKYGAVPLHDAYDRKSAVYLVRARYHAGLQEMEEWLSLRFVPSEGFPRSSEDLDATLVDGVSLRQYFQGMLAKRGAIVSTISRLCAIRPYATTGGPIQQFSQEHTALCFAFANKVFFEDSAAKRDKVRVITMMAQQRVVQDVFQVLYGDTPIALRPTLALKSLRANHIVFDRNVLSYEYPRYFLDPTILMALLMHLYDHQVLTDATFAHYLHIPQSFRSVVQLYEKHGENASALLTDMGRIITVCGQLVGSRITGEALRELIDMHVPDAPQLYCMPRGMWQMEVHRFLKAVEKYSAETIALDAYGKNTARTLQAGRT